MKSKQAYSETTLWWQWVIATSIGLGVGAFVAYQVNVIAVLMASLGLNSLTVSGALIMIGVGLLQGLVLRKYLAGGRWWVVASVGGWLTYGVLAYAGAYFFPYARLGADGYTLLVRGDAYTGGSIGFWIGLFQWLLLRRQLKESSWWIPISTIAFALGLQLAAGTGIAAYVFPREGPQRSAISEYIILSEVGAVGGLIIGSISGLGLLWLLRRQDHEPQATHPE